MNTGFTLSRKTLLIGGISLLAVAGLWASWHFYTHPPPPWMVRMEVMRYLKKNGSTRDFKVAFPFPSKQEMRMGPKTGKAADAGPAKGKLTGKDFDTLSHDYCELMTTILRLEKEIPEAETEVKTVKPRVEQLTKTWEEIKGSSATNRAEVKSALGTAQKRLAGVEKTLATRPVLTAKQQEVVPIASDLWDFQRAWAAEIAALEGANSDEMSKARGLMRQDARKHLAEAKSYEPIYKVVGQHLWVAEQLLESQNPGHRRMGVSLAWDASQDALDDAQNGWLAARIVQGYVWPNLDLATDANRRSPFNLETMVENCARVFRQNDEPESVVRTYKILMAQSPQRADQARAQLAMMYEQSGDIKEAIAYLRQIKATNDFRWAISRLPRLERQLK